MEVDFPENTVSPRLDDLVHDSSNRNTWKLVGEWFGTDYAILGRVKCLNHRRGEPPEDTVFMLKFLPYTLNEDGNPEREVRFQEHIARFGLAPKIIDSWITPTGVAMVMEKLDIELGDLLVKYESLEVKNLIMASALSLIQRLHNEGAYHGDTHLNNIMVVAGGSPFINDPKRPLPPHDPNSEVARYKAQGYRFYFIDFGESECLVQPTLPIVKRDYTLLEGAIYDLLHDFPGEALRSIYDSLVITIKSIGATSLSEL